MKLSKLSDYAVVILLILGQRPRKTKPSSPLNLTMLSAREVAQLSGLNIPTVSKILKLLQQKQIVTSIQGVKGGYFLAKSPPQITVLEIIQAINGPVALTECVESAESVCEVEHFCAMRGNWDKVNEAVLKTLREISLIDMAPQFTSTDSISIKTS